MLNESKRGFGGIAVPLSIMMFLEFFIWGAWYVSTNYYMGAREMGSEMIGWAYSVGPIAAIVSPFFLGMVADRFFSTEKVLGVLHILGGAVLLTAPSFSDDPTLFVVVLLVHMLLYMPTLGLTNSLAMTHMTNQEKQFPLIRVFGTGGWIVAGVIVSKLFEADTHDLQYYIAGGAGILMGAYCFFLPHTPPPSKGKKVTVRDVLCLDALSLLKDPSFAIFIVCSMLICIPLAAYYAFGTSFLGASGFENPTYYMSFGQMSEVLFMLIMPLFFVRLGVKYMLLVGMLAWVVRYALFYVAAPDSVRWMIMGGVVLHGICYDFFFVTGQIYTDKKASSGIRAQAQGFLVLMTQGIGLLVGAQIMGRLNAKMVTGEGAEKLAQWGTFWLVPTIMAGVVMVVFFFLFRNHAGKTSEAGEASGENP